MPISIEEDYEDIQPHRNITILRRSRSVSELESPVHLRDHSLGNQTSLALVLADDQTSNSSKSHSAPLIGSPEVSLSCQRSLQHPHVFDHGSPHGKTQNVHREKPKFMEYDGLDRISLYPTNPPILIRFNVSGEKFLVMHSTLRNDPYVYKKIVESVMWLSNEQEYYIERDPTIFHCVHNYLRLGELHLPTGMCETLLERELDDWGIVLGLSKQRCCLGPFLDKKCKLKSLQEFENRMQKMSVKSDVQLNRTSGWRAFREVAWMVINSAPDWSKPKLPRLFPGSNTEPSGEENSVAADEQVHRNPRIRAITLSSFLRDYPPTTAQRVRILRRVYFVIETTIALIAVVFFMLSSVHRFRQPLSNATSDAIAETKPEYYDRLQAFTIPKRWILTADVVFAVVFTLDAVARFLFCPKCKIWLTSIYTYTDLTTLVSYYFEVVLYTAAFTNTYETTTIWIIEYMNVIEDIRGLKVLVVLRLLRALRWHTGAYVILYTVRKTLLDVGMVNLLILTAGLFFGAIMYYVDSGFLNIPLASYWALITLSTVGYGDMTASTTVGYIVTVICVLLGQMLIAYLIPILVDQFLLYYNHSQQLHMLAHVQRIARSKLEQRGLCGQALGPTAGLALDAKPSSRTERMRPRDRHGRRTSGFRVRSYSIP